VRKGMTDNLEVAEVAVRGESQSVEG
jgi:hypothetical protein